MVLKQKFRKSPASVTSFDFVEFLTGNGYVTFYGGVLMPKEETYESYLTGDDSDINVDSTRAAQTFTIGNTGTDENFWITKVRLLRDTGTLADIKVEIHEVTSGEPNGTIKWSNEGSDGIRSLGASDDTWVEWNITDTHEFDNTQLQAGTMYAIVVYRYTGSTTTKFRVDSSGSYTGGKHYVGNVGSWVEDVGATLMFEILGSTTNPYTLSTKSFDSLFDTTNIKKEATSTSVDNLSADLSFEGIFNKTAILKGTAIVTSTITSGADMHEPSAEIFHVRDTTATSLGSAVGFLNNSVVRLQIPLTTTPLNAGDKIRLVLSAGIKESDDFQAEATFAHNGSTDLLLDLPFRTD